MVYRNYNWVQGKPDREHILEIIKWGEPFAFQFNGKDYFIELQSDGYVIQDADVQPDGTFNNRIPYPGHNEAQTAEEFLALKFLDGKTFLERFDADELRFID